MLKPGSNLQKAVVAGFSMSGSLLAFGIFGYLVSKKYDNQIFLLFGLILGTAFGLYEIFRQMKKWIFLYLIFVFPYSVLFQFFFIWISLT